MYRPSSQTHAPHWLPPCMQCSVSGKLAIKLHCFWQAGIDDLNTNVLKHEKRVNLPGLNGLPYIAAHTMTGCRWDH